MRQRVRDCEARGDLPGLRPALSAFDRPGIQRRTEHRRVSADHLRRRAGSGVPGQKYTFGIVKAAQARGDLTVLQNADAARCESIWART